MCPRQSCEEMRRFIASVGSPSVRQGESTCHQVIRQKLHLNPIYSTCSDCDRVDSESMPTMRFSWCARFQLGFDYRHLVRHPVLVSPDTVILLPTPSTRYRHPVLDDGYRITVEFWCGTRWWQYRSGTGWRYWEKGNPRPDHILAVNIWRLISKMPQEP